MFTLGWKFEARCSTFSSLLLKYYSLLDENIHTLTLLFLLFISYRLLAAQDRCSEPMKMLRCHVVKKKSQQNMRTPWTSPCVWLNRSNNKYEKLIMGRPMSQFIIHIIPHSCFCELWGKYSLYQKLDIDSSLGV